MTCSGRTPFCMLRCLCLLVERPSPLQLAMAWAWEILGHQDLPIGSNASSKVLGIQGLSHRVFNEEAELSKKDK